jgi:hypothetical protein
MLPVFVRAIFLRVVNALLNVFTIRSTQDFERFTTAPIPGVASGGGRLEPAPAVVNVEPLDYHARLESDPAGCEELFTRLIRSGSFDSAWDLLTPDSQASWERREVFRHEMAERQPARSLVGSTVREVRFLPSWTDRESRKTYHQVAELVVDYRIRQRSREMVVTKDVHLVNVSGGWKSLCYRT